jgi:hypothetical protein
MNLEPAVKELQRQVVKLENWIRRLEDSVDRILTVIHISTGALLVGTTTALTGFLGLGKVQVDNTAPNNVLLHMETTTAGNAPSVELLRRRSGWGVVSSGDRAGTILFSAADSVDAAPVAQIHATVDGTPGSNDMPGRLVFSTTADGANAVTEAMRITSAQRIGLGNTSPLYPVHIGAGADTLTRTETALAVQVAGVATITARNATADVEGTFIAGGASVAVGAASNHSLLLLTNNATVVTIDTAGNVGVANTTPLHLLHVGAGADTLIRTETALAVQIVGTATITARNTTSDIEATLVAGGLSAAVGTASNHTLNLITNNATAVTVLAGGNVGIANTTPSYQLHVGAGADTLVRTETAIAAQVAGVTAITARNTTADVEGALVVGGASVAMGAATNHPLLLITNNTTAATIDTTGNLTMSDTLYIATDQVRARDSGGLALYDDAGTAGIFIEDGGFVGVGTATPDAILHVSASGEILRLADTSASGTPFMSFYQTSTRRSYIGHSDTNDDLILASEYGTVSFWTGTGGTEVLRATFGSDGHLTFADSLRILVDEVRGRDSGGLYLRDDAGTMGIKVVDGGSVIIGEDEAPNTMFEVRGSTGGITLTRTNDTASAEPFLLFRKGTAPATICQVRGIDGGGMRFTNGGASTEWARFDSGGLLGVGDSTPDGQLDVNQASTTAAIPTLELHQGDLSEEFINFVGTIGAGNSIEADTTPPAAPSHKIRVATNGTFRYIYVFDS